MRARKAARRVFDHIGGRLLAPSSLDAAQNFTDGSLDMVFVDAEHDATVETDLLTWEKKIRPGRYIVGHDFNADWPDVLRVVMRLRAGREVTFGADFTYFWRV